ncbi:hypothetical protein EYW49_01425 [Siculibacillus lacustris]|uniref:Uncharacterized protein n=1 Tax=Siculibacillus lacustris TaxID=1549641 RepID=A0A4V2KUG2_9HYPH|nr:hypothetical protein [Siculibacillus lacustris]TBW41415.1 hypothetical protein EYW49_01425 [Siculibacillus lacustris]
MRVTGSTIAWAVLIVGGCFGASVAMPLATYTLALACFGLVHVGTELRFVDLRFSGRLYPIWRWIAPLLVAGFVARSAGLDGILEPNIAAGLELACGAGLMFACSRALRRRQGIALVAGATAMVGAVMAPAETMLAFAVLHNFTPLALVTEAVSRERRGSAFCLLAIGFVALPALIVAGWPADLLYAAGLYAPEYTILRVGGLEQHLGVYVPPALAQHDRAVDVFSAAVFTQCLHYAIVIHVLPRLLPATPTAGFVHWPKPPTFVVALSTVALVLIVPFWLNFSGARKLYGLAAMTHAWIEIPVLLLMLGGRSD